jgi:hypothetical protein
VTDRATLLFQSSGMFVVMEKDRRTFHIFKREHHQASRFAFTSRFGDSNLCSVCPENESNDYPQYRKNFRKCRSIHSLFLFS